MGLLLAAAAAAVIYLVYYIFDFYRWVAKYPRGPTPLPFVGNLLSVSLFIVFDVYAYFSKPWRIFLVRFKISPSALQFSLTRIRSRLHSLHSRSHGCDHGPWSDQGSIRDQRYDWILVNISPFWKQRPDKVPVTKQLKITDNTIQVTPSLIVQTIHSTIKWHSVRMVEWSLPMEIAGGRIGS